MAHIPLPENLLARLRRTAQQDGLTLPRLFERMLDAYQHAKNQAENRETAKGQEPEAETDSLDPIAAEATAFLKMHPSLVENYLNQYVAIYQGKLIDHDVNKLALYDRIEETHPNNFVLMRPVQAQPEREFYFRSPRYIERI